MNVNLTWWDKFVNIEGQVRVVVMAKARFNNAEHGEQTYWKECSVEDPGPHAERKALIDLEARIENHGLPQSVYLYMSYSPCGECADYILEFFHSYPDCEVNLIFRSLYFPDKEENQRGLRRLNARPGITIRVTEYQDWRVVAEATGKPDFNYTHEFVGRDMFWREKLQNILEV